jgi:hypothetical protein
VGDVYLVLGEGCSVTSPFEKHVLVTTKDSWKVDEP